MAGGGPQRRRICIGRVVGVRGVDGWLKVHAYTRSRTGIFGYEQWLLETERGSDTYRLEAGCEHGRGLIAKLLGVDDRDAAAALVGASICVGTGQLPALAEGEFYWHQIEGLRVETTEGLFLGTVDHLLETGANDVMVVKGDRERLIPYTAAVVRDVDLGNGVLRVDWDPDF